MSRKWKGEGGPPRPLILPAKDIDKIAHGRKTQIRRVARAEQLTGGLKPPGMKVGSTFDVQTSQDGDPLTRIVVTSVTAQKVTDITLAGAKAEGYHDKFDRGRDDGIGAIALFAADWMLKHDRNWPLLEEDICPECDGHAEIDGERCHAGCDEVGIVMVPATLTAEQILHVFRARHARRWVWVVSFEVAQHLYLHKLSQRGYTANPADALVDAGTVLGPPSPDWRERAQQRRLEALRDRDGARLAGLDRLSAELQAEANRLASESDTDVSGLVREATHKIDRIKKKVEGRSDQHRRAA